MSDTNPLELAKLQAKQHNTPVHVADEQGNIKHIVFPDGQVFSKQEDAPQVKPVEVVKEPEPVKVEPPVVEASKPVETPKPVLASAPVRPVAGPSVPAPGAGVDVEKILLWVAIATLAGFEAAKYFHVL